MTPVQTQIHMALRPLPPLPIQKRKQVEPITLTLSSCNSENVSHPVITPLKSKITVEDINIKDALDKAMDASTLTQFEKKRVNWAIVKGLALVTFGLLCTGGAIAGGVLAILGGGIPGIVGGSLAIGFGSAFGLSRIHQGLSLLANQTQNPTAKAFLGKLCGVQSKQTEKASDPQVIEVQPDLDPPPPLPIRPQNAELLTKIEILKKENEKHLKLVEEKTKEVESLRSANAQQPVRVQVLPDQGQAQKPSHSQTILLEELKAMKIEDEERLKHITVQTQEIATLRKALEEALDQVNTIPVDSETIEKLQKAEKEVQALTLASVHLEEELARKERELDLLKSRIQAMENGTRAPAAPLLPPPPPPMPAPSVSPASAFGARPASFLSEVKNPGVILRKTPTDKKDLPPKKALKGQETPQDLQDILKNQLNSMRPAFEDESDEEDESEAVW